MVAIKRNDTGPGVMDVQERLVRLGFLAPSGLTGTFDEQTLQAVQAFTQNVKLGPRDEVDDTVWARLVDESFEFGDRNLYLRVPFFHGHDVATLQQALSALGFSCGAIDGIFGAHTEQALRAFQLNMGLPSDGIAGGFTFRALNNLSHSWKGKTSYSPIPNMGFARAADVLEHHVICLYGTSSFSRSIAARMSNLALATNPESQIISADSLLVEPDPATIYIQVLVEDEKSALSIPVVEYEPTDSLALRLSNAMVAAEHTANRIGIHIAERQWYEAGDIRSAQHYAIVLLDAICAALLINEE